MQSLPQGEMLRDIHRLFESGSTAGQSEKELLSRFVAHRDEAAFLTLLARYGPMVLGVCRRWLHDPRDAEDAFQATFLVLIRKADSIKDPHMLGPWLYGVSVRIARRARRLALRRGERERSGLLTDANAEDTHNPSHCQVDQEELRITLDEEIQRLPEALRLPVALCLVQGMTQPEAARRLRTTPDSIRGRLARAREKLQSRLTRRGFALPAGLLILDLATESASATPTLPPLLIEASLKILANGTAPTATISTLSEGVIRAMSMSRLKVIAGVVLALGAVAAVAAGSGGHEVEAKAKAVATPPEPLPTKKPTQSKSEKADRRLSEASQPHTVVVEVRDLLTGSPIPDVKLSSTSYPSSKESSATTNAAGLARFDLPDGTDTQSIYVSAKRKGLVSVDSYWSRNASLTKPPDRISIQMEKGTELGGRVLDQDEQPVIGATVIIQAKKRYPKSELQVRFAPDTTTTDANGRWTFSNVPTDPESISLAAYHHLYLTSETSYQAQEYTPQSALRDRSAVLKLQRGTPIEGTVHSPDGQPIAGATVYYGLGRAYGNAIPPIKTDAQGKFVLGIKPGTISSVIAHHPGFGPAGERLQVGTEPQQITLTLPQARTIRGRIVDRTGKPIPGAAIYVGWSPFLKTRSDRASEAISLGLQADEGGHFTWNDAPNGNVWAEVVARQYCGKRDISLSPDQPNTVVLTAVTTIKGTVIDDATGQPIPEFKLSSGVVYNPGESFIWQGFSLMEDYAKKSSGAFTYESDQDYQQYVVRVVSENHLPADSKPFTPDGSTHEFTFRLTRAEPIRGTVLKQDGTPTSNGFVVLIPAGDELKIQNGRVLPQHLERMIHGKIADDGKFQLPPQRDDYLLVALDDAGIAMVHRRDFRTAEPLRLQAWSHVSGTVSFENRPTAGVELTELLDADNLPSEGEPRVFQQYFATTDAAGRFVFPRVVPGSHVFGEWVPNGAYRRIWFVAKATVDAQPGQTYQFDIGRSGHLVTGRLALPKTKGWMIRKAEIESRGAKRGKPYQGVQTFEDGRFRVEDLAPGDYRLRVIIHEPPSEGQCGWGRLIASFSHEFTIQDQANENPLDLGVLKPVELGSAHLKVGDQAPDFTVKTLDGKELTLAGLRGKYVLLDFWATWCAPCLAEQPNLKAIHTQFGDNPRFAMLSLSIDEKPDLAHSVVQKEKMPGFQGHIDPDSPVVDAYEATAIPATFLIDPQGKIVAKGLQGEQTKAEVEKALKP